MKVGDALLEAIIASPDDDLPRLAYADWCEENGDDPRAELIRGQIALAKDRDNDELQERVYALLREHERRWTAPLDGRGLRHLVFRRGFVESANIASEGELAEHAAALVRMTPIRDLVYEPNIGGVPANERVRELDRLAESPAAGLITTVYLRDAEGMPILAKLLGSPAVNGVKVIQVFPSPTNSGREACRLLAAATHLKTLHHLSIWADDVGDTGVIALAGATHLASLRNLKLENATPGSAGQITSQGVGHLSRSPNLPRLWWLDLRGSPVGDLGMIYLAASQALTSLGGLSFCRCGLTELGLRTLGDGRLFPALRHLSVDVPELSPSMVDLLVASPVAARLEWFYLGVRRRPEDAAQGDALFRERFGDEAYERLKGHFGDRIACTEWHELPV